MKVGFIGLGNMGLPMAQNLLKAGNELVVYNRTASKAQPILDQGARLAASPAEVARQSEVVFTMLADDKAVEAVTFGEDGILDALPEGSIHVSSSTISLKLVRRMAEAHAAKNRDFASAPVLGRPNAAEAAILRIMVGGSEEVRERINPLLEAMGNNIFVCGDEAHMANAVKLGNNFLIISILEGMAEAMTMTRKHGVDPNNFLPVVNSFFRSPIMEEYGRIQKDREWKPAGFTMRLGLKDVTLMLEAAEMVNASMPIGDIARNHFIEGIARGWEDYEWAALIKPVETSAGLELD